VAGLCHVSIARANDATLVNPMHGSSTASSPAAVASGAASAPGNAEAAPVISIRSAVAKQLREAIEQSNAASGLKKKPTVQIESSEKAPAANAHAPAQAAAKAHTAPAEVKPKFKPSGHAASSKETSAHAPTAAHDAHAAPHWSYEGETGPQAWGQLQPSFNLCAIGKRQSPIHIDDSEALLGPAEPLQINYVASAGSVVNNGHTIEVDPAGNNTLTVRGSTYKLIQFHFHHPAEEKLNYKGFAMVAHLVHQNAQGQLAVLAVLFDPGETSPLIQKIWTHMPLDVGDRVNLPEGLIDLNETLPKDMRYYQFMGSLTTPPCTEGVLWLVLRQPMTLSPEQLKLFAQLFPNNARPTQPSFGRVVREAQ
jgi:carbonic anhydrase